MVYKIKLFLFLLIILIFIGIVSAVQPDTNKWIIKQDTTGAPSTFTDVYEVDTINEVYNISQTFSESEKGTVLTMINLIGENSKVDLDILYYFGSGNQEGKPYFNGIPLDLILQDEGYVGDPGSGTSGDIGYWDGPSEVSNTYGLHHLRIEFNNPSNTTIRFTRPDSNVINYTVTTITYPVEFGVGLRTGDDGIAVYDFDNFKINDSLYEDFSGLSPSPWGTGTGCSLDSSQYSVFDSFDRANSATIGSPEQGSDWNEVQWQDGFSIENQALRLLLGQYGTAITSPAQITSDLNFSINLQFKWKVIGTERMFFVGGLGDGSLLGISGVDLSNVRMMGNGTFLVTNGINKTNATYLGDWVLDQAYNVIFTSARDSMELYLWDAREQRPAIPSLTLKENFTSYKQGDYLGVYIDGFSGGGGNDIAIIDYIAYALGENYLDVCGLGPEIPLMSDVQVNTTQTTAILTWTTKNLSTSLVEFHYLGLPRPEANDSFIEYQDDAQYLSHTVGGDSFKITNQTLKINHSVEIRYLEPEKDYEINVRSLYENGTIITKEVNFTTGNLTGEQQIGNINLQIVNLTQTSATFVWTTENETLGYLFYGNSTDGRGKYKLGQFNSNTHTIILKNLNIATTYPYKIYSWYKNGDYNFSSGDFTTLNNPIEPSSGGGGGGGGSNDQEEQTAEETTEQEEKPTVSITSTEGETKISIENPKPGEDINLNIPNEISSIKSITINPSSSTDIHVDLKEKSGNEISDDERSSNKKVYRFYEIEALDDDGNDVEINFGVFKFGVEKEWLNQQDREADNVVLNRFKNNAWTELKTTSVGDTSDEFLFEAETPGFSLFSISLKEVSEETRQEPEGNLITGAIVSDLSDISTSNITTTILLIIAVALLLALVFKKKEKHARRQSKSI